MRVDGFERFFFRCSAQLGLQRFPGFAIGLPGLRLRVREEAGQQVGGQDGVLVLGPMVPEQAEQSGARAAEHGGEFIEMLE